MRADGNTHLKGDDAGVSLCLQTFSSFSLIEGGSGAFLDAGLAANDLMSFHFGAGVARDHPSFSSVLHHVGKLT
jgi:hypothetical protein